MKFILSILMLPLIVALSLAGLLYGFFTLCVNLACLQSGSSGAHALKGCLYLAAGIGLPLAVLTTLTGVFLAFCAFVFKSWSRAIVSLSAAFLAFLIWRCFLFFPLPL